MTQVLMLVEDRFAAGGVIQVHRPVDYSVGSALDHTTDPAAELT